MVSGPRCPPCKLHLYERLQWDRRCDLKCSQGKSALYLITLVTCLIIGMVHLVGQNGRQIRFSIIFDCGSTDTRMHVYKLQWQGGMWTLLGNFSEKIPKGLIFYAEQPDQAAFRLKQMLRNATCKVPSTYQHITPVSLGATIALKSLKENKGNKILAAIRKQFYSKKISPFKNGTTDYLDGTNKAFYYWATISFLKEARMTTSNVAALNLGVAFNQVALRLDDIRTAAGNDSSAYKEFTILDKRVWIYAKEYEMGLDVAREKILKMGELEKSPCTLPENTAMLDLSVGFTYKVSGLNHSACYNICRKYVENIAAIEDLNKREIFATGNYFLLARQVGMINEDATEGDIDLLTIEAKAMEACAWPDDTLCVDLTYIYALLKDGFKLLPNKTIHVVHEISHFEVGWTLGMALSQLYFVAEH